MKAIKALSLASAALVAALVAGCDNKPATAPMPVPPIPMKWTFKARRTYTVGPDR